MLSITVDTLVDENNGVSVGAGTSLREAITAAAPGDTINFSVTGTITPLTLLPTINKNLTIAGPGRDQLTIQGSGFNIGDNKSQVLLDVFISGLTITGSHLPFGSGGGINTTENLTVSDCAITNCSTGNNSDGGGGIYSYAGQAATLQSTLTVRNTILSGNMTPKSEGGAIRKRYGTLVVDGCTITGNTAYLEGGGISVADSNVQARITNSVIVDNHVTNTASTRGYGGGIYVFVGALDISNSVVSGNSALSGGGIAAEASTLSVTDSTISGNTAIGTVSTGADGAGIWAPSRLTTILRSTIDGNTTSTGRGGGIYAGSFSIVDSTISGNSAATGGGLYGAIDASVIRNSTFSGNTATVAAGAIANAFLRGPSIAISNSTITANTSPALASGKTPGAVRGASITSSIVAGNVHDDVAANISSGGYNIVGTGTTVANFNKTGDQSGITDPLLGLLTDNGGPTKTHMPLAGSPAVNAGNPAFNPANPDGLSSTNDATPNDQRGATFGRIYGGRIDIGAVERQPIPSVVVGDFNQDSTVDLGDYVFWRKTLGSTVTAFTGADASGNGVVDQADYAIWRSHFGYVIPLVDFPGSGSSQSLAELAIVDPVAAADTAVSQPPPSFVEATPATSFTIKPVHAALTSKPIAATSVDSAMLNLMSLSVPLANSLKPVPSLGGSDAQSAGPDSRYCEALEAAFAKLFAGFAKS